MSRAPGARPILLVADDEREIRELVVSVARRTIPDVSVLTAADAFEAEALVRANDVDGILTDLRMPSRSGLELLATVREISPATRRALMTGYHEDIIDGVSLAELGLVRILRKPFTASDLRAVLRSLVDDAPVRPAPDHTP